MLGRVLPDTRNGVNRGYRLTVFSTGHFIRRFLHTLRSCDDRMDRKNSSDRGFPRRFYIFYLNVLSFYFAFHYPFFVRYHLVFYNPESPRPLEISDSPPELNSCFQSLHFGFALNTIGRYRPGLEAFN